MNATSNDTILEPGWLTYTKGMAFTSPAVAAWAFACVWLVPKANEICQNAGFGPSRLGWLWPATFVLVHWGRLILIAGVLTFVLLEFAAPRFRSQRRLTVGIGIWLANVAVLFGLTMLLIMVLVAAPSLAHS
jgi:hypothetical protein